MPYKPKTFGSHRREFNRKRYENTPARKADKKFYGSAAWLKFRRWYLNNNPLCAHCHAAGRPVPAKQVHHVRGRHQHPEDTFDPDQCEGLCLSCHSRVTATETGFGR